MKTLILAAIVAATIPLGAGCSDESMEYGTNVHPLDQGWTCGAVLGPVNGGPGVCPDCVLQLCVEVLDASTLRFGIQVEEEPLAATQLCRLSRVLVKQSSTTLFEDEIPIAPIDLRVGFTEIGEQETLAGASSASVLLDIDAEFTAPECDDEM